MACAVLVGAFLLSLPHLQPLLLRVLVDQKAEQLKERIEESLPLESPELPLEFPAPAVENNVAGEVARPSR